MVQNKNITVRAPWQLLTAIAAVLVTTRGYLQHKMQLWTVLLLAAAYFSGVESLSNEAIVAFLVIVVLYSVSESSVFPNK